MTSSTLNLDVGKFTVDQWAAHLDAIRKLGDVYEKKRRIEQLLQACEQVDRSEVSAPAWTGLQTQCATLTGLLEGLPTSVLEDRGARVEGQRQEVIGETLDELFGGLNLAGAGEDGEGMMAPPLTTSMGFTEGSPVPKVVELRPGRQYRKVIRKNGGEDGVGVQGTGRVMRRRHPDVQDATSADEQEDEDVREVRAVGCAGERQGEEYARGVGGTGDGMGAGVGHGHAEDVDVAQLEAARYGEGQGGKRDDGGPGTLDIPVDGEVLARAAAGAPRGNRGGESPSSSGGSTHAIVGKNGREWYGRVGADERRLGSDGRSESSGSESGESLTSPAVVVESTWR